MESHRSAAAENLVRHRSLSVSILREDVSEPRIQSPALQRSGCSGQLPAASGLGEVWRAASKSRCAREIASLLLTCASEQEVPDKKRPICHCNYIKPSTKSHFEVTVFVQYFNTLNAITSLLIYLSLEACVWTWFIEWVLCQLTCNRLHNIQKGSFAWHYIRSTVIATQSNVNEFWEAPSFMLSCTESYYYLLP